MCNLNATVIVNLPVTITPRVYVEALRKSVKAVLPMEGKNRVILNVEGAQVRELSLLTPRFFEAGDKKVYCKVQSYPFSRVISRKVFVFTEGKKVKEMTVYSRDARAFWGNFLAQIPDDMFWNCSELGFVFED